MPSLKCLRLPSFLAAGIICLLASPLFAQFTSNHVKSLTNGNADIHDVVETKTERYCVYEPPVDVVQRSKGPVPIVVYLHGWLANDESYYEHMLRDLCRQRYVVIFPKFEGTGREYSSGAYDAALDNTFHGLLDLENRRVGYLHTTLPHHRPTMSRWAIVGHSGGGMYALKVADYISRLSRWIGVVVPPRAIVLHDAGGFSSMLPKLKPENSEANWLDDLSGISGDTELMLIASRTTWDHMLSPTYPEGKWGNSLMGGVWSRAWFSTRLRSERKNAVVVPGGHAEVQNKDILGNQIYHPHYRDYLVLTKAALKSGFASTPSSSNTWNQTFSQLEDTVSVSTLLDNVFLHSFFKPVPWNPKSARVFELYQLL